MATIRKRGDSYQIRVSCGYDMNDKQVIRTKSWTPKAGMTKRQIEKELNRQAVMFEEACNEGFISSSIKFSDFLEQWKEDYAKKNYKMTTIDTMAHIMKRIEEELGHYKLSKITRRTIQQLIKLLSDGNGKHGALGPKTVRNYIHYVSSMFEYAIKLDLISTNPCHNVSMPTNRRTHYEMYTVEEAQIFIDALTKVAPIKVSMLFPAGDLRRFTARRVMWAYLGQHRL